MCENIHQNERIIVPSALREKEMKFETKQKLETVAFCSFIVLTVVAMLTIMTYGSEWALELSKQILGIL